MPRRRHIIQDGLELPILMVKIVASIIGVLLFTFALSAQNRSVRDQGIELYRAGDFQSAVSALRSVVDTDKADKLAWIYPGAALLKSRDAKGAAKSFRNSNFTYKDEGETLDQNVKVIRKPRARFTDRARQNMVTGTVKIAVEFGADGRIGFIFPFQTLPEGLADQAISAAKDIDFEPAVHSGKPVSVVTIVTYTFSIY